jgi:hypothetical protein
LGVAHSALHRENFLRLYMMNDLTEALIHQLNKDRIKDTLPDLVPRLNLTGDMPLLSNHLVTVLHETLASTSGSS